MLMAASKCYFKRARLGVEAYFSIVQFLKNLKEFFQRMKSTAPFGRRQLGCNMKHKGNELLP